MDTEQPKYKYEVIDNESGPYRIRQIVIATNVITTLAGSGSSGECDGTTTDKEPTA